MVQVRHVCCAELSPFHLAIPVRDVDEARRFYAGLLRCPEVRQGAGALLMMPSNGAAAPYLPAPPDYRTTAPYLFQDRIHIPIKCFVFNSTMIE